MTKKTSESAIVAREKAIIHNGIFSPGTIAEP
jgi:hypothetical protein